MNTEDTGDDETHSDNASVDADLSEEDLKKKNKSRARLKKLMQKIKLKKRMDARLASEQNQGGRIDTPKDKLNEVVYKDTAPKKKKSKRKPEKNDDKSEPSKKKQKTDSKKAPVKKSAEKTESVKTPAKKSTGKTESVKTKAKQSTGSTESVDTPINKSTKGKLKQSMSCKVKHRSYAVV